MDAGRGKSFFCLLDEFLGKSWQRQHVTGTTPKSVVFQVVVEQKADTAAAGGWIF
jgi:hypothetical protein